MLIVVELDPATVPSGGGLFTAPNPVQKMLMYCPRTAGAAEAPGIEPAGAAKTEVFAFMTCPWPLAPIVKIPGAAEPMLIGSGTVTIGADPPAGTVRTITWVWLLGVSPNGNWALI
jgi:hypothetical protein